MLPHLKQIGDAGDVNLDSEFYVRIGMSTKDEHNVGVVSKHICLVISNALKHIINMDREHQFHFLDRHHHL